MQEHKEYCKMIAKELNVKSISFNMATSEKGKIKLNYYLEDNHFNITIKDKVYWSNKLKGVANNYLKDLFKIYGKNT